MEFEARRKVPLQSPVPVWVPWLFAVPTGTWVGLALLEPARHGFEFTPWYVLLVLLNLPVVFFAGFGSVMVLGCLGVVEATLQAWGLALDFQPLFEPIVVSAFLGTAILLWHCLLDVFFLFLPPWPRSS